MKILIVDDTTDDRNVLRYALEAHGHEVMEACNGQEGALLAAAQVFDLILSDVLMPVMDGFQFLRTLRGSSSIPFVFYSAAYGGMRDKQLAASLGATGFLVKPMDPVVLIEELERIAGRGPKVSSGIIEEDIEYLKKYSQVVASKLEEKVRELEQTLVERKRGEELLLAKQQRLTEMAMELSIAEERERRRIAVELHDSISQTLLLGKIKLRSLIAKHPDTNDKHELEEILHLQDDMIRSVRSLTQQLSPPILSVAGLEDALEWLGKRMMEDYGLRVLFVDDQSLKPLTEDMRAIVFQACRELLINVAKHAETESARVIIGREGDRFYLAVEDHGVGFDLAESVHAGSWDLGFGLFSIRERIKHLGGEVLIESASHQGTRVTLWVGLKADER
ncbi:MAG: response regulator [Desulfuromonadaceae bacterium]|nr:response regulator [Desulfuromonadaceae bacterium]MDD5106443.1 response regulator [Desulfuromonadaceae bacterium]